MNEISQQLESDVPARGRVIPFEKPQNAMQRAVQIRAQETIERHGAKPKIEPLRIVLTLAVAAIPVLMLVGALDAFVRAMHMFMQMKNDTPTQEQAPAPAPVLAPVPQEPGVVFVVPPMERPNSTGANADRAPQAER